MNKFLIFGFLIAISLNCLSQEYRFKEPSNLKLKVILRSSNDKEALDTASITYYDNKGNIIKIINKSNNQNKSCYLYHYDSQNKLIEFINDLGKKKYISRSDSLIGRYIFYKYIYKYKGNNLIEEDRYDIGESPYLSYIYKYDDSNRIIKELTIDYLSPNVYSNPNKVHSKTKTYKYYNDLRICEYFDSTKLMGIDTTFYRRGLIQKKVVYSINGLKIAEDKYSYNNKNELIEYYSYDSGESPFGRGHDIMYNNWKENYTYDTSGFLNKREIIVDGKFSGAIYYIYK